MKNKIIGKQFLGFVFVTIAVGGMLLIATGCSIIPEAVPTQTPTQTPTKVPTATITVTITPTETATQTEAPVQTETPNPAYAGKNFFGTVEKWDPEKGDLAFKGNDGHEYLVHLDGSSQEMVLVGNPGKISLGMNVITAKSEQWTTAFCPNDPVTVLYDQQGKVKIIENVGYRKCGK
jgi:hypothetical protein